jgi:hypothetical protein
MLINTHQYLLKYYQNYKKKKKKKKKRERERANLVAQSGCYSSHQAWKRKDRIGRAN